MSVNKLKCFACERRLGKNPALADTRDGQIVFVGSECIKAIREAGEAGYQPPEGGPRLWVVTADSMYEIKSGHAYQYIQFLKQQKLLGKKEGQ